MEPLLYIFGVGLLVAMVLYGIWSLCREPERGLIVKADSAVEAINASGFELGKNRVTCIRATPIHDGYWRVDYEIEL